MIRFRRPQHIEVGDSVPEVIMLNSHDGTSSYQLMQGWFRLVCSNGLVVVDKDREISGVRVNHRGKVLDNVIEAAYTVINESETQANLIEDMRTTNLSDGEQNAFAMAAAALRFDEDAQVRPEQILRPHRSEDRGSSLWLTLNRAQENLVNGGIRHVSINENGAMSYRRSRQVNGIDGNLSLNRGLWILAEEMRKLKAN